MLEIETERKLKSKELVEQILSTIYKLGFVFYMNPVLDKNPLGFSIEENELEVPVKRKLPLIKGWRKIKDELVTNDFREKQNVIEYGLHYVDHIEIVDNGEGFVTIEVFSKDNLKVKGSIPPRSLKDSWIFSEEWVRILTPFLDKNKIVKRLIENTISAVSKPVLAPDRVVEEVCKLPLNMVDNVEITILLTKSKLFRAARIYYTEYARSIGVEAYFDFKTEELTFRIGGEFEDFRDFFNETFGTVYLVCVFEELRKEFRKSLEEIEELSTFVDRWFFFNSLIRELLKNK